jgi:predicted nucleic acid-binding protein
VIFVDTSYWIALRNRRDTHHEEAERLARANTAAGLITTNHVCGETWTYLRRKAGFAAATGFLTAVRSSSLVAIRFVAEDVERLAWSWLQQHDEKGYSFVDATSFVTMQRLRLRQVLAFDGDFAAAGYQELRAI